MGMANTITIPGGPQAKRYPKGNLVLFQGEIPRYDFYVQSGSLKLYAIDNDGNERVVGFCSEGDIFPLDWLLGGSRSALFYYETITEALLIPLSRDDVEQNKEISRHTHQALVRDTASALLRNL